LLLETVPVAGAAREGGCGFAATEDSLLVELVRAAALAPPLKVSVKVLM
jgi:hypothetical protein